MTITSRLLLVVDDELLVRWSLAQHLGNNGFRLAEAGSVAEARAHVAEGPLPDLLLLDLKLPDGDGLDLLETLRRDGAACPAIMMSAHWTPEAELRACAMGAFAVVRKPFELDAMKTLAHRALEGGTPGTPGTPDCDDYPGT